MTTATELLQYAVESFRLKVSTGQAPSFTECMLEALHVHDPERYDPPPAKEPRFQVAGKLGPWARHGCRGDRYLAVGLQEKPEYKRISWAENGGDTWRYVRVLLEGQPHGRLHGCGTTVYERVN